MEALECKYLLIFWSNLNGVSHHHHHHVWTDNTLTTITHTLPNKIKYWKRSDEASVGGASPSNKSPESTASATWKNQSGNTKQLNRQRKSIGRASFITLLHLLSKRADISHVFGIERDLKQNDLSNTCGEHSLNISISVLMEVPLEAFGFLPCVCDCWEYNTCVCVKAESLTHVC